MITIKKWFKTNIFNGPEKTRKSDHNRIYGDILWYLNKYVEEQEVGN